MSKQSYVSCWTDKRQNGYNNQRHKKRQPLPDKSWVRPANVPTGANISMWTLSKWKRNMGHKLKVTVSRVQIRSSTMTGQKRADVIGIISGLSNSFLVTVFTVYLQETDALIDLSFICTMTVKSYVSPPKLLEMKAFIGSHATREDGELCILTAK